MTRLAWASVLVVGCLTAGSLALIAAREGWSGLFWSVVPAVAVVLLVLIIVVVWLAGVRRLAAALTRGTDARAYLVGTSPPLHDGLWALPYVDELGVDVTPNRIPPGPVLVVRPGYLELWSGAARDPRLYLRLPTSDVVGVQPTDDGHGVEVTVRTSDPSVGEVALPFVRYGKYFGRAYASQTEVVRDTAEILEVVRRPTREPLVARNGRAWRAIRADLDGLVSLDRYELDAAADILDLGRQTGAVEGRVAALVSEISERLGVNLGERIIAAALAAAVTAEQIDARPADGEGASS